MFQIILVHVNIIYVNGGFSVRDDDDGWVDSSFTMLFRVTCLTWLFKLSWNFQCDNSYESRGSPVQNMCILFLQRYGNRSVTILQELWPSSISFHRSTSKTKRGPCPNNVLPPGFVAWRSPNPAASQTHPNPDRDCQLIAANMHFMGFCLFGQMLGIVRRLHIFMHLLSARLSRRCSEKNSSTFTTTEMIVDRSHSGSI